MTIRPIILATVVGVALCAPAFGSTITIPLEPRVTQRTDFTDFTSYQPAPNSSFYADVLLNGKPLRCLVDTGAYSGMHLTMPIAEAYGVAVIRNKPSTFDVSSHGEYQAFDAVVGSLIWGAYKDENVPIRVGLHTGLHLDCLLGMDYLQHFDISIKNGVMEVSR